MLEGAPISNEEFYEAMDAEDQFVVGTPDQVIEKMERYREVGLDHMMCTPIEWFRYSVWCHRVPESPCL